MDKASVRKNNKLKKDTGAATEEYVRRGVMGVRRIIQFKDIVSRELDRKHGITIPQMIVLMELLDSPEKTVNQIAESSFLVPSTMVGILDRLKTKGFITKRRDNYDRRRVYIGITPEGEDHIRMVTDDKFGSFGKYIMLLPKTDQKKFAELMDAILAYYTDDFPFLKPMLNNG